VSPGALAIIRALNFIESNLEQAIDVQAIAASAGYSLYHFSRLFQALTGTTPAAYLAGRRLTEAARDLLAASESQTSITEIAFKYQFESHETFSRAFKRTLGLRPSDMRGMRTLRHLPRIQRLTEADLLHRSKGEFLEPEVVCLDAFCVVGMSTLVRDSTGVISELWAEFGRHVEGVNNRLQPERWYEVGFWSGNLDGWFSMPAVEVANLDQIPAALVGKVIPPAKYARFAHKGLSREVGLTWKYIHQTWLPRTKHRLSHPYQFEVYGSNYLGPHHRDSESEIYLPIE